MSTLYSSFYLKNLSQNKTLNESRKVFSARESSKDSFDIFLSHSYLDKGEVEGLYIELTRFGFSVYVDWIVDPILDRNNVTKATATLIRDRLKASKTLLLAVSTNASMSKWMPWELGYVDGHTQKCAIIPVSREAYPTSSFKGLEYLSLYPFIKKENDSQEKPRLWVIEDARKYIVFEDWLNGKIPFQRDIAIY